MTRSLFSSSHSVLQVSEAILLRFGSSSSNSLPRCGQIPPCSMGSRPRFYAPLCRLCSSRSSWPFWIDCDSCSTSGDEHPTQLCLYCLGARRDAFWLRLHEHPRLDLSTNLHVASLLQNDLCRTWRRAYIFTICIQVRNNRQWAFFPSDVQIRKITFIPCIPHPVHKRTVRGHCFLVSMHL